ncbi:glycosyltransferase [Aquirhabdus parva]|uniref:Glycosyltransferase n=1 Tax=Aquirhabdus parva TaxID=2283318 RepID=A0A345P3W0_9GAMM|nr:glycosyltransferase [Aquirhabdus parva]AXI01969.1 glycosyltransferase [Aquirhabdus parva]
MRIVIDMQGVQGGSRYRGIGRYTIALTQAIIKNGGQDNEIILALNGMFPESVEFIRAIFSPLLPKNNIRIWQAQAPVSQIESANDSRREAAELIREAFLASLNPDIVLVSSLFEGFHGNAVTSVGLLSNTVPTAVILYDLIPYINRDVYLANPLVASWYDNKIDHLRRADILFGISESSRQEGIGFLGFSEESCINISTAADEQFQPQNIEKSQELAIRSKYQLKHEFLMYTGGIDPRKNIEGLICAYAQLPISLRNERQLAIVCDIQPPSRAALEGLIREQGLSPHEVILTGFVPEKDLIALYNLCQAFVFPSWHEGFGLPALEAMACGRAVIAANTSSLPEVVGNKEALFNPLDQEAMTAKLYQVLTDADFRLRLQQHGLEQAKLFSWDTSAIRLLDALNIWFTGQSKKMNSVLPTKRLKLAYVSPLPPERSGISDYSAELLPELSRYYDIEVIVEQSAVIDPWVSANCQIRDSAWLRAHADKYERVLYHFGNSHFHQHMFSLLKEVPGVVVLHDFFLSGIVSHMELTGYRPDFWRNTLLFSHGYIPVEKRYHIPDIGDVIWEYPANAHVLQDATGVIVHAENSRRLSQKWYGQDSAKDWAVIPHLRTAVPTLDSQRYRAKLGISENSFVICSFGLLGPTKQNRRLLDAWLASDLAKDPNCVLIFVGENHNGEYGNQLVETINKSGLSNRIRITGWTDTDDFRKYLSIADLGVQLRTLSRGETSGTVLDCMNYGLPTIVNSNGSMADLPDDGVLKLPDLYEDIDLINALEMLWSNPEQRSVLGRRAREIILTQHNPRKCASQYAVQIERIYAEKVVKVPALINAISELKVPPSDEQALIALSESIDLSIPPQIGAPQFLVDISELVRGDSKSGIQRVVRSILLELLLNPPVGFKVEPIYANGEHSYYYARNFTLSFLDCPETGLPDEPISFKSGDVFLGLDLHPFVLTHRNFYQTLRNYGVEVRFVIYDLLSITHSQFFNDGAAEQFHRWLKVYAESDGIICISQSVATDVMSWLKVNGIQRERALKVNWFHLGADIQASKPTTGLVNNAASILAKIKAHPSFLMVGTVEPRKGHKQVLDAFNELWANNVDVNLVIVGKSGWRMEETIRLIRDHSKLNRRLFWLESISDEFLEQIYENSSCLIAASYGEGFGLPLIEAAQHKLPIIARDIPVFREVAGANASYYSGHTGQELAATIQEWLARYSIKDIPLSDHIPWLTWRESTSNLLDIIVNNQPYLTWEHDGIYRYWGSDDRLNTVVGKAKGHSILSNFEAGCLIYGPYINLSAGDYTLVVFGELGEGGAGGAYIDIAVNGGTVLLEHKFQATEASGQIATLTLRLERDYTSVEIRTWVTAQSDITISRIELSPYVKPIEYGVVHYCGSDSRFHTQAGRREGLEILSSGKSGYLLFGLYIPLKAGNYVVVIEGEIAGNGVAGAYLDVAVNGGEKLAHQEIRYLSGTNKLVVLSLHLERDYPDVEVRVWVNELSDIKVSDLLIYPNLLNDEQNRVLAHGSRKFLAADSRIYSQVGRYINFDIFSTGVAGYLLYGPYLALPSGSYQIKIYGRIEQTSDCLIDVVIDRGSQVLASKKLSALSTNGLLIILYVQLDHSVLDMEVRVKVDDQTSMQLSSLEFIPIDQISGTRDIEPESLHEEKVEKPVVSVAKRSLFDKKSRKVDPALQEKVVSGVEEEQVNESKLSSNQDSELVLNENSTDISPLKKKFSEKFLDFFR